MEELNIGQRLHDYQVKKAGGQKLRSQRDEYINKFLEELNPDRKANGYREYTPVTLSKRIHNAFNCADTGVLYLLWKKCNEFDNFSKGFHYLTRK